MTLEYDKLLSNFGFKFNLCRYILAVDQRTPLCLGSANEVDRFNKMVLGK